MPRLVVGCSATDDDNETNNENGNIRDLCKGISEFNRGYQP
jgi:hypothetical protein